MARVPVATIGGVENRPASIPYQNASGATADAFGAAQGRAAVEGAGKIMSLGDRMAANAIKIQDEDNERETKRLDVELSQAVRALTVGDDKTPGFYSARGEAAVAAHKDAEKAITEARRKLLESTKNARVREMFGSLSAARVERELGGLASHVAKERRVANDAISEARINEASDDAGAHWNNSKVIGQSSAIARQEVADMAARNGWNPVVTASKMQEAQTVLHRRVIESALVHDPGAAKAYFDQNKDKIDGRVHPELEKALEAGTLRQQSQAKEDEIMARGLGEGAAMSEARKIKDAKLRDETVARLQRRFAEKDRIDADQRRKAKESAWQGVINGGSVDDIDPTTLANMDGTSISAMRTFEQKRAKDGRGFANASEPAAYNELHQLYMSDRAAFASADLTAYLPRLDERDYQYWLGSQRTIDRNDEKEKARGASYVLADRLANEYMKAANIDPNKKGANAEKAEKVRRLGREVVDTLHKEGKRTTREDLQKAYSQLFLSGEVEGAGFLGVLDKGGKFFEFAGTKDANKFVLTDTKGQEQYISEATGVPREHVEAIVKTLKDKKLEVNLVNIQSLWQEASGGR
jgi:hypothetical protein